MTWSAAETKSLHDTTSSIKVAAVVQCACPHLIHHVFLLTMCAMHSTAWVQEGNSALANRWLSEDGTAVWIQPPHRDTIGRIFSDIQHSTCCAGPIADTKTSIFTTLLFYDTNFTSAMPKRKAEAASSSLGYLLLPTNNASDTITIDCAQLVARLVEQRPDVLRFIAPYVVAEDPSAVKQRIAKYSVKKLFAKDERDLSSGKEMGTTVWKEHQVAQVMKGKAAAMRRITRLRRDIAEEKSADTTFFGMVEDMEESLCEAVDSLEEYDATAGAIMAFDYDGAGLRCPLTAVVPHSWTQVHSLLPSSSVWSLVKKRLEVHGPAALHDNQFLNDCVCPLLGHPRGASLTNDTIAAVLEEAVVEHGLPYRSAWALLTGLQYKLSGAPPLWNFIKEGDVSELPRMAQRADTRPRLLLLATVVMMYGHFIPSEVKVQVETVWCADLVMATNAVSRLHSFYGFHVVRQRAFELIDQHIEDVTGESLMNAAWPNAPHIAQERRVWNEMEREIGRAHV